MTETCSSLGRDLELSACWTLLELEAQKARDSVELVVAGTKLLVEVRQQNPVGESVTN
jgi:hypothetical protein